MLHVHRAERADRLAEDLAETLAEPLADPFVADIVAVPTRGVERWLAQRLSARLGATPGREDGVCANVTFPFPGVLVQAALAAATGIDPEHDPWPAERSVWPLLEVVDRCLEEPWLATLAAHLHGARGEPGDPPRRFAMVRHLAGLFEHYGVQRPQMVVGWSAGEGEDRWQAELWRRLRARIGRPSPAERLASACATIRERPDALDLPPRLSLFGLTRIPRSYLEALAAIAAGRDVHLFILHPSPALWRAVAGAQAPGPGEPAPELEPVTRRRDDHTARLPRNRLLASWGRDARELQLVVSGAAAPAVHHRHDDRHRHDDHHHHAAAGETPRTLLARIQADIRADRRPPGPPLPAQLDLRPPLDPDDRSLQVYSCHGRARQVEVLRDAVLHMLAEDPTLEPRDVIVMCPDIETFAPLIQATFGAAEHDGLPDLRVRLADRALRQTNPVLTVMSQLLELADQRATASQLLDLASRESVRRRFGFDDDELARLQEWVAASGIRWGFDAAHREPFRLGTLNANTWRRGLDRILAGVTMTEDDRRLVHGVLPLDDVESGAIDLAGRLAEYVERVRDAVDALTGAKSIGDWARALADGADALTATGERDSWQRRELQRLLDDVLGEAHAGAPGGPGVEPDGAGAGSVSPLDVVEAGARRGPELELADAGARRGPELELADVRALLADRLKGRPTRANFRTGHLTVCTLVPMRSVPHRVVCVIGLDDGEFPRRTRRDGDDVLLQEPHVGDRDPRSEDRQMLLDALLAATERLVITYTGNDERTNLRRPPAVPVAELLDTVERTVSGAAREQVVICHPLQPFDPRNFTPGALVPRRPWGFNRQALAGAQALTRAQAPAGGQALSGPRVKRPPLLTALLPPRDERVIELDRLVRFVQRPVRALLRERLGLSGEDALEEVHDAIPLELDALERWGVGQRLLEGVLAGAELDACLSAERARGLLPPAGLAVPVLQPIRDRVRRIAAHVAELGAEPPTSLDVYVALADGRTLAGTATGVCGDTLRVVSYSRVRPRARLAAWVRLLALTAARPDRPYQSLVIGRARSGAWPAEVTLVRVPPLADDPAARRERALAHLSVLLDLYDRGMREPLPLSCETSAAYAEASAAGRDGIPAARRAWQSDFDRAGEDQAPEHRLVFGGRIELAELMAQAPRPDERGAGWEEAEVTRFGRYARRLWSPVLAAEVRSDR